MATQEVPVGIQLPCQMSYGKIDWEESADHYAKVSN
jgi:hypothetical protein